MSQPRTTENEFLESIGHGAGAGAEPERVQLRVIPSPVTDPTADTKRVRVRRMSRKQLRQAEQDRLADTSWVPIKKAPTFVWYKGRKSKPATIAQSIRSLVMNLKVGTPEVRALEIVGKQYSRYEIGKAYLNAAKVMSEEGAGFRQALIAEEIIPRTVKELIAASATSAALQENLTHAATLINHSQAVKRKLIVAMISPASTVLLCIVALFVSSAYVIPGLVGMFVQLDAETPAMTLILLQASEVTKYVLGGLMAVGGAFGLYWMLFGRKSDRFKSMVDGIAIRIPQVGPIIQLSTVSRLFHLLATNLQAGMSEPEALRGAASGCGNEAVKYHCLRHAERMLAEGVPLKDFVQTRLIPEDAANLLASSPSIGQEIETMREIGPEYRAEADIRLEGLSESITPIVSVFVYVLAALLVVAMVLPIYDMYPAMTQLGDY